jgi:uncharacterized protein
MTTVEEKPAAGTAGAIGDRSPRATLLLDTDTHPAFSAADLLSRLDEPWRSWLARADRGGHLAYPRLRNAGFRVDARVEGGAPGSDVELMRRQALDEYGTDFAILIPLLSATGPAEYQAAMAHAVNEWVREEWLERDPRFRATLQVPFDYPDLAVKEIARYSGDRRFVQVQLAPGAHSEWGDRKYWPIYEACADAGLVVMSHVGGTNNQYRGAGAPSFYLEQHLWLHGSTERIAMSMICEGVFEQFPKLQMALIEACISWAGPLQWAMDAAFEMLHDDLPRLGRKPSEYFREHFWFSTQPIEEPDDPRQLLEAYEFTGMTDRIMFSSDYPHWDFDSPARALPVMLPRALREKILGGNACRLYGLGPIESAG